MQWLEEAGGRLGYNDVFFSGKVKGTHRVCVAISSENAQTSIIAVRTSVPTAKQRKSTRTNIPDFQMLLSTVFHQITKKHNTLLE